MATVSIKDATQAKKGSIVGTIKSAGEISTGVTNGKEWSRRDFVIEDASGSVTLTVWGDEINDIDLGKRYAVGNPMWKEYGGKMCISRGKFGKIEHVVDEKKSTSETTNNEFLKNKQQEINETKDVDYTTLGLDTATVAKIIQENAKLDALCKILTNEMTERPATGNPIPPRGDAVGMRAKILYDSIFK